MNSIKIFTKIILIKFKIELKIVSKLYIYKTNDEF